MDSFQGLSRKTVRLENVPDPWPLGLGLSQLSAEARLGSVCMNVPLGPGLQ